MVCDEQYSHSNKNEESVRNSENKSMNLAHKPPPPPLLRNFPSSSFQGIKNHGDDFYANHQCGENVPESINIAQREEGQYIEQKRSNPLKILQEKELSCLCTHSDINKSIDWLKQQCIDNEKKIQEWKNYYETSDFKLKNQEEFATIARLLAENISKNQEMTTSHENLIHDLKIRAQLRGETFNQNTIILEKKWEPIDNLRSKIESLKIKLLELQCEKEDALTKEKYICLQNTAQQLSSKILTEQTKLYESDKLLSLIRELIAEELMIPRYVQYAMNHLLEYNHIDIYDLFLKVNIHYFQALLLHAGKTIDDCEFQVASLFDLKRINIDSSFDSLVNVFFIFKQ